MIILHNIRIYCEIRPYAIPYTLRFIACTTYYIFYILLFLASSSFIPETFFSFRDYLKRHFLFVSPLSSLSVTTFKWNAYARAKHYLIFLILALNPMHNLIPCAIIMVIYFHITSWKEKWMYLGGDGYIFSFSFCYIS